MPIGDWFIGRIDRLDVYSDADSVYQTSGISSTHTHARVKKVQVCDNRAFPRSSGKRG